MAELALILTMAASWLLGYWIMDRVDSFLVHHVMRNESSEPEANASESFSFAGITFRPVKLFRLIHAA